MKKGFVSIFTLVILLILSVTISFLYTQNLSTAEYNKDLYEKKQAQYRAESVINLYIEENTDYIANIILDDYNKKYKDSFETRDLNSIQYVDYEGKKYGLKITYLSRAKKVYDKKSASYKIDYKDDPALHGLYNLYIKDGVKVGKAKGFSEVYFKVVDSDDLEETDSKARIEIVIRRTY